MYSAGVSVAHIGGGDQCSASGSASPHQVPVNVGAVGEVKESIDKKFWMTYIVYVNCRECELGCGSVGDPNRQR